jgi:hypothetical protein
VEMHEAVGAAARENENGIGFFSCDTMRPVSARCSRQVCMCMYVGGSPVLWDRGGPGPAGCYEYLQ